MGIEDGSSAQLRGTDRAADVMTAATLLCQGRGGQLTPTRRAALEVLLQSRRPLTAYEVMARLEAVLGRKLAPPTAYRALDFLTARGLARRIESRNAYVACAHPERMHVCVFFVCDHCDASTEIESPALEKVISRNASSLGFKVVRRVVELQGTCARCLTSADPAGRPG